MLKFKRIISLALILCIGLVSVGPTFANDNKSITQKPLTSTEKVSIDNLNKNIGITPYASAYPNPGGAPSRKHIRMKRINGSMWLIFDRTGWNYIKEVKNMGYGIAGMGGAIGAALGVSLGVTAAAFLGGYLTFQTAAINLQLKTAGIAMVKIP